jgi:hypothetical protein
MTREVPPFLAHLRRDRRGLPVPYINLWGVESPDRLSVQYDPHVPGPGVYFDDTGQDVPDFTAQNMQRQRECMVDGLCQVCARHVPWSRRYLVVAELSVQRIDLYGKSTIVVTEPWLDERCAQYALETCPALIRRRRDEKLWLVPIRSKLEVVLIVSTGYIDGPDEELSKRLRPAIWVKAALPGKLRPAAVRGAVAIPPAEPATAGP